MFSITSLFQMRMTRYPRAAKSVSRRWSAVLSACWPPSTSTTNLRSRQTKSA